MPQKGATFLILNDKDERNGMKGLVVAGIAVASLFAGAAFAAGDSTGAQALAQKTGCMACHGVGNKIVGPAFKDVAAKYKGDKGAEAKLIKKVKNGGSGVWGSIPMPPHPEMNNKEIKTLIHWVLTLG